MDHHARSDLWDLLEFRTESLESGRVRRVRSRERAWDLLEFRIELGISGEGGGVGREGAYQSFEIMIFSILLSLFLIAEIAGRPKRTSAEGPNGEVAWEIARELFRAGFTKPRIRRSD